VGLKDLNKMERLQSRIAIDDFGGDCADWSERGLFGRRDFALRSKH